jgi:DNA-binding response OmpR family regulator
MLTEPSRTLLRDLGRTSPATDASHSLSGLVVLSVGHGSPEHIAVNRALKTAGAVVLVRTSAAEAVQMLRAFVPSLVVTEVVPGDDSGSAVLRAIRRIPPDHGGALPVIGVCARTTDAPSTIRAEFQGLLTDPFEPGDVARTVLGAIESSS